MAITETTTCTDALCTDACIAGEQVLSRASAYCIDTSVVGVQTEVSATALCTDASQAEGYAPTVVAAVATDRSFAREKITTWTAASARCPTVTRSIADSATNVVTVCTDASVASSTSIVETLAETTAVATDSSAVSSVLVPVSVVAYTTSSTQVQTVVQAAATAFATDLSHVFTQADAGSTARCTDHVSAETLTRLAATAVATTASTGHTISPVIYTQNVAIADGGPAGAWAETTAFTLAELLARDGSRPGGGGGWVITPFTWAHAEHTLEGVEWAYRDTYGVFGAEYRVDAGPGMVGSVVGLPRIDGDGYQLVPDYVWIPRGAEPGMQVEDGIGHTYPGMVRGESGRFKLGTGVRASTWRLTIMGASVVGQVSARFRQSNRRL